PASGSTPTSASTSAGARPTATTSRPDSTPRAPAERARSGRLRGQRRALLVDRQVCQRGTDRQHDVGPPHPVVAARPLERLATQVRTEEAADLVREHDD